MFELLLAHGESKGIEKILFICDPNDELVMERLASKGLTPAFAEYRMVFEAQRCPWMETQDISLVRATLDDHDYIESLDAESFGHSPDSIRPAEILATQIIMYYDEPVGKLRIDATDGSCGIYGVVVEQRLRGQGIGGRALKLALDELMNNGVQHIYLEVDSKNPGAFHLYKKLGFGVEAEFQYYPYEL